MVLDAILVTGKVTTVLEQLKIRYFIGGSFASTYYGMVRTTQGSDIVAEFKQDHIDPFVQKLERDFYIDHERNVKAVNGLSSFNIIHRDSFFKVDIFVPQMRPYLEQQFSRAHRQVISIEPAIEAQIASAEDTLIAKLEWYRMGGEESELQWRDVLGVLKVQAGTLDRNYLEETSDELGLSDLLDKARNEAKC